MVRLALRKLLAKWNFGGLFDIFKDFGINTTDKLLSSSYSTIIQILCEESEEDRELLIEKIVQYKKENVRFY